MLHVCRPGYEPFLVKELGGPYSAKGPGWVEGGAPERELCFAHWSSAGGAALEGASARALAQGLVDYFLTTSRGETYDASWPLVVEGSGEPGAEKRARGVEELFLELAKKRVSRVAKLAVPGRPGPGKARGLFCYLTGLHAAAASREAWFGGQRRMADDAQAPSRSYLKVEEAYAVLGEAPVQGQLVADLGAAPGGWSYSAAKRGARVLAVDNGPLKGGGLHPNVEHHRADAFTFAPPGPVDWLFCDMVEDPDRVLALIEKWLSRGMARRFIVNLKFGRTDPLPLLRRARGLSASRLLARHLFHDREEFTLAGAAR